MRPDASEHASGYRPDVDGLRAIAVLLVLGFHAFPNAVPGGFVGVDIFFVISGFLISGLITRELAAARFSLLTFYGRRARRIFPALFVVLLACLAAGWLLLPPVDYRNLGADAAWAGAFAGNFALYLQSGYFDAAAETKPLLHLWSLGIEEQFYIAWPLLLIVTAGRRRMWQAALAVLAASFLCNIALTSSDRSAAFYLPFSRVWELAAGALLALLPWRLQHGRACGTAAASGLVLIAASVVLITPASSFPGWWALLPVSGAMLVILAGPSGPINRLPLSHGVLVYIGLISYPLYLWHWPLLVFTRIARFGSEPPILMKLALLGAAFVLAHLTYQFIERPFRFGSPSPLKALGAAAGLAASMGAGIVVWNLAGVPTRFNSDVQFLLQDFRAETDQFVNSNGCVLDSARLLAAPPPGCIGAESDAKRRLVLLWGDSFATHLYPGLADLQARHNFNLATYASPGCPPVLDFASHKFPDCRAINAYFIDRIEARKPHTVILAGRWDIYGNYGGDGRMGTIERSAAQATLARLAAVGVQRIVVVGQFPVWRLAPAHILLRQQQLGVLASGAKAPVRLPEYDAEYLERNVFAAETRLKADWSAPNVTLVSPRSTLCEAAACRLRTPGSPFHPLTWDFGHLTVAGSVYFVSANADQLLGR